jgi:putative membrane protein
MMFTWIKVLHVISMVTWIGGMLMLCLMLGALASAPVPRLPQDRRLMVIVRRWDLKITTPAMALTWLCGFAMAILAGWLTEPWLVFKLFFVFALSALHGVLSGKLRRMIECEAGPAWRGLRHAALITMVALGAIVVLVLTKPF